MERKRNLGKRDGFERAKHQLFACRLKFAGGGVAVRKTGTPKFLCKGICAGL